MRSRAPSVWLRFSLGRTLISKGGVNKRLQLGFGPLRPEGGHVRGQHIIGRVFKKRETRRGDNVLEVETMVDMTAVTGALTALRALTGIAKDVNNIEFNQKIIELQQKLLDIQIDYGTLLDENRALKAEIEAGKAYELHHSVVWRKLPEGGEAGPFCPICRGKDGKEIPLHYRGPLNTDEGTLLFACPIQHVAKGEGRNTTYHVPKVLVPEDRYTRSSI